MKKVSIVTLICVVAAFSIVAYAYFHLARKGAGSALAQPLKSKDELPKGAYVYRERKLVTEGDAWDYTVYLPPELYSKETIERCFQWYAKKYPDEMTDLYMEIFTNKDTMEFYMTHIFTDGGGITEQLGATYFRSHLVGSHGEINEYYSYSPENNYRHSKYMTKA